MRLCSDNVFPIFTRLRRASPKETEHNLVDRRPPEHSYANVHKQDEGIERDSFVGVSYKIHSSVEHTNKQSILNTPKDRSGMRMNDQDFPHIYDQPSSSNPVLDYSKSSMNTGDFSGYTYIESPVNDSTDRDDIVPEHTYLNNFDDDHEDTAVGIGSETVYETVD